jgi:hypothetical protein
MHTFSLKLQCFGRLYSSAIGIVQERQAPPGGAHGGI